MAAAHKKRPKRKGRGKRTKKQLQNGMLYALRPFPLRRRLINICNPSQNAATTRSERTLHRCCEFISFDPISSALLLSRSPFVSCCAPVRLVIPAVSSSVDPVVTAAILNHVSIYVVTRDLRFLPPSRLESA